MATAYIQHHVIQIPAMKSDCSWRTKSSMTLPAAADTPTRTTPTRPHGAEELARLEAAMVIQRWWVRSRNRRVFCLLKKAICAAEHSLTREILRKVSPLEAELLRDPAMQARVKFRFGGIQFPPAILFKIFTASSGGGGGGVQYISGKKMIKPASEAAEDARRQMGNRVFYDQLLQDACRHQHLGVTEEVDVTTVKEYMQYVANVDESPASAGGRENTWRKLNLEVLPRHSFLYNIVEFLGRAWQPGGMSLRRLQSFTRPPTQYEQIEHIKAVSSLSPHRMSPRKPPPSRDSRPPSWGRRSRQAQERVARMRRAYTEEDEGGDDRPCSEASVPDTDAADMGGVTGRREGGRGRGSEGGAEEEEEEEWEREVDDLYHWTQELSFEDIR